MNPKKQQSSRIRIVFKLSLLLTLAFLSSVAQDLNRSSKPLSPLGTKANNSTTEDKLIGKHTLSEWRNLIDFTWGEGLPTEKKLQIFDRFWNDIDANYPAFINLHTNWDSLKTLYRPEVEAGVSRGRFAAIMSVLAAALSDLHTVILDFPLATDNLNSGTPMFVVMGDQSIVEKDLLSLDYNHFGATLSPQPDSTLLVINAVADHPLGLQRGDIILGYDGVLWKNLYNELLAVEFPFRYGTLGSNPQSVNYNLLTCAGENWHLFDTIDIVKYSSNDTLHLSTSLLENKEMKLYCTPQLPITGVPFPDIDNGNRLSYGVIESTKIGYVYVWGWVSPVGDEFVSAISKLINDYKIDGLIIDSRYNSGGNFSEYLKVINVLFNEEQDILQENMRSSTTDHFAMTIWDNGGRTKSHVSNFLFDKPIALLTGPFSWSCGDFMPFEMKYHPMVRTFGLGTNGALGAIKGPLYTGDNDWVYYRASTNMTLKNNPGQFLYHSYIEPDETVWFTRNGVANGEDDVVKKAVEWITSLTYAHNALLDRHYATPATDSVCLNVTLTNSLNHTALISAIVTDAAGTARDSIVLRNDGLHGDATANDSIWSCRIYAPSDENMFKINVRTDDVTLGTFRSLRNVASFTTAGPLTFDSAFVVNQREYAYCGVVPFIKNNGTTSAVTNAFVTLVCNDPWVKKINPLTLPLPSISAGASASPSGEAGFTIDYDTLTFPHYFNAKFELTLNGQICWTDSARIEVDITGISRRERLPTVYALIQNFPNPFNPTTQIRFEIPVSGFVSLKVFDVLGREVATLVNEKKSPGVYNVEWNASNVSSGVYFYRLSAGSFVETKKMILMR